jgi:hypothetical protein
MLRPTGWRDPAPLGYGAALLAFASAGVSLFWALGGTLLLDTVGGAIEELARERSPEAIAVGIAAALLKAGVGVLAIALVNGRGGPLTRRWLVTVNAIASAVLVAWGGINVAVGALVLSGIVSPSGPVDERALRWHVFLWDLWFLVWGVLLALAVARQRRRAR